MKKHLVYRLTYLKPIDERIYYIGKHSCDTMDIGTRYFTSSLKVSPLFKNNPQDFKVKIIGSFNSCEEAVAFEGKIHARLDVENNRLFYNEQNQNISGHLDRTGRVTVINRLTKEKLTISTDLFYNNRDTYESVVLDKVNCIDTEGNIIQVDKKEFDNNDKLHGVNKGILHVYDKHTNKKVSITKETFQLDKDRYIHALSNNISVYDTVNKKKTVIPKELFDGIQYIGIKKFTGEKKHICEICSRSISSSNYERHVKKHYNTLIWVTDNKNFNSFKCLESDFYAYFNQSYYIIKKNKDKTFGYVNGVKHNIRYVGRINKKILTKDTK